jgi:outer membrane protein OmpA-like peptidoglycan-associated protein
MKKVVYKTLGIVVSIAILSGCSAYQNSNNKQRGAVIGAASGAVIGGIIGNNVGKKSNTAIGAIIGAAVGGVAGGVIGDKMDRQAEQIQQALPDAEVTRVGEGINVVFDEKSGIYFDTNKYNITATSQQTLDRLSIVFGDYPDTNILVEGHTDDTGSDVYNQTLSENRANAVRNYLVSKGLSTNRFTTKGHGETQPKYDNTTPEGRSKNRRVEFAIVANDKMIQEAKAKGN